MGQNSSLDLNITKVIKQWIPTQKDPSIFINRTTKQHLQCYHIEISLKDLINQIAIYNARIQVLKTYVCKIAYFNQVFNGSMLKGHRRFAVYTDHLFFVRDYQWSPPRFIDVLEGVLTLTSYYGYFRLTEKMVFVNEKGQTKVWISENPANNHRDHVSNNEEQAIAAFAGLATSKNYEVANLLIGCVSFQDALLRLKKPRRKKVGEVNNMHYGQEKDKANKRVPFNFHRPMKQEKINNINLQLHIGIQNQNSKHYSIYQKSGKAVSSRSASQCKNSFINQQSKKKIFQNTYNQYKNNESVKVEPSHYNKMEGSPKMRPTTQLSFKPKRQYNTTNNLNHVSNNFIYSKPEQNKTHTTLNYFRDARTPEFVFNSLQFQNSSSSKKKQKGSAPFFLQKKNRVREDSFNCNKMQTNEKESTQSISSKPFILNNDSLNFSTNNLKRSTQLQLIKGRPTDIGYNRNQTSKLYTFFQPASIHKATFNKSFSPQSKEVHSKYIQNRNLTQFFKKPNRTFTTSFNDNSYRKQMDKQQEMKSKNISFNKIIPEDITQNISSQSIAIHSISTSQQDIRLKQQMNLQFSQVLHTQLQLEIPQKEQEDEIVHQDSLKQKIQQKKMAFAQLKKEALAVLTDFL